MSPQMSEGAVGASAAPPSAQFHIRLAITWHVVQHLRNGTEGGVCYIRSQNSVGKQLYFSRVQEAPSCKVPMTKP